MGLNHSPEDQHRIYAMCYFLDLITTELFALETKWVDCKHNNNYYYYKRNSTKDVNVGLFGSPEHHWQRLINKYIV